MLRYSIYLNEELDSVYSEPNGEFQQTYEGDGQHRSREHSRVNEASTSDPTSALIDTNEWCRSTPLEIHNRLSCSHDISDSTLKSSNVSCYSLAPYVDKEITTKYFLELEEFLELEDEELPQILDSGLHKATMAYFLGLEEWLEDLGQSSKN